MMIEKDASRCDATLSVGKRVILVNPPIVSDENDVSGSGIPHQPVLLASLNAYLKSKGIEPMIIDLFGESPRTITKRGHMLVHGSPISSLVGRISDNDIVFIYASFAFAHTINLDVVRQIRSLGSARIYVIENTQSALGYDISEFRESFMMAGVTALLLGDSEVHAINAVNNLPISDKRTMFGSIKDLPTPDWTSFPIENYWSLPYAHAPKTDKKYMSIMTSRGCPKKCDFCAAGGINNGVYRSRTASSVFKEIMQWYDAGIKEFHICDLNPTFDRKMWIEICFQLMLSNAKIKLRFATGVKLETIDEELMEKLLSIGCDFISFSPESGADGVLTSVGKTFDYDHAIQMLKLIKGRAVTQACFIIGLPSESCSDRDETLKYAIELADAGLDEIALFNFTPMPGAKLYKDYEISTDKMTFSNKLWGDQIEEFKRTLLITFYLNKMIDSPFRTIGRFFRTKTWMTVKRMIATKYCVLRAGCLR